MSAGFLLAQAAKAQAKLPPPPSRFPQGEGAAGWSLSRLVVAKDLVARLAEKAGVELQVLATAKVGGGGEGSA